MILSNICSSSRGPPNHKSVEDLSKGRAWPGARSSQRALQHIKPNLRHVAQMLEGLQNHHTVGHQVHMASNNCVKSLAHSFAPSLMAHAR